MEVYYKLDSIVSIKLVNKTFNANSSDWIESKIFNTKEKVNEVNENVRISKKKVFKENKYFDIVQKEIIDKINNHVKKVYFSLVRDDIELVKYDKGDFFEKHQDFVKYTSNQFECFSLILYLNDDYEGGKTNLYISDDKKIISDTKKGQMLIFKNEIVHEGEKVTKGTKYILRLNLIGSQKNLEFVVIKFVNDTRYYIINAENINGESFLGAMYNFNKKNNKGNILVLEDYSYEEFSNVYEIINNKKVNINTDIYDFFGIDKCIINIIKKGNVKIQKDVDKYHEFKNKIETLDKFKKGTYFFVKDNDEYNLFLEIFKQDETIIPVQYLMLDRELLFVTIKDFIPIYSDMCNIILNNELENEIELRSVEENRKNGKYIKKRINKIPNNINDIICNLHIKDENVNADILRKLFVLPLISSDILVITLYHMIKLY